MWLVRPYSLSNSGCAQCGRALNFTDFKQIRPKAALTTSPNTVLFDRAFPFVMGPMKRSIVWLAYNRPTAACVNLARKKNYCSYRSDLKHIFTVLPDLKQCLVCWFL